MNTIKAILLGVTLMCAMCSLKGLADDVIVNSATGATALDRTVVKNIFQGKTVYWSNGEAVMIILLANQSDTGMDSVAGMSASQFRTHWQRLNFSGRGRLPKNAETPEEVIALVAKNKGAIAIVPSGTVLNGVTKLEIK